VYHLLLFYLKDKTHYSFNQTSSKPLELSQFTELEEKKRRGKKCPW